MTGLEQIVKVMSGEAADRTPTLPMMHTGLATIAGVPLGPFFNDAAVMADVMVGGAERFGFDGVQLSQGVTGEAEALGATVAQPDDAGPVLQEYLLAEPDRLDALREHDPATGGRMPMFFDAVERVVRAVGDERFVLATLRGPLLITSQLRGAEPMLMDMMERPEWLRQVLEFTVEVAERVGVAALETGAHGLLLGEAVCSPNFISPAMYREQVWPMHCDVVRRLKQAGWLAIGLHVCGNITPILEDLIATGVDFLDIDYQVSAADAIRLTKGRVAMRGNLDPSSVLRFGDVDKVRVETRAMCEQIQGARWIAGSGCDIPPGTPAENVEAFVETMRTWEW